MPPELLEVLKTGGPLVVLLAFIGWWGLNRKWVFGWLYDQEQARHKDEIAKKDAEIELWRTMAINSLGLADQASRQAVKAVGRARRGSTNVPPPA